MSTTSALPGTHVYDWSINKWDGNPRQLHSMIPAMEIMLKQKAVYHLFDFNAFPSPVEPVEALHFKEADRVRIAEAVAKHMARVDENATCELNHGTEFRRLRQTRDIEGRQLSRYDEDHYWWMLNRRPREPKYKHPRILCLPHYQKAILDYPDLVKKEKEQCSTVIEVYEYFLSSTLFHEYRSKLWDNRLNTDTEREQAVFPLIHLKQLRSTPNTQVLKEIEADFTDVQRIDNFKSALAACAILTKLQEELSNISIALMKTDDFMIQSIVKKFNYGDNGLQQFMIKHGLGEGILAPETIEITSYGE